MRRKLPPKNGFTLVELLVAISIIAILSVVGIVAYGNVQKNARDTKRKADIDAIARAYEVKYTKTGSYSTTEGEDFTKYFALGAIPVSPEGGQYFNLNTKKTFRACAKLKDSPETALYCVKNDDYCYCKSNVQGGEIKFETPSTDPKPLDPKPLIGGGRKLTIDESPNGGYQGDGDVNDDKVVDDQDSGAISNIVVGKAMSNLRGDINRNGSITSADITCVLKYITNRCANKFCGYYGNPCP